MFLNFVLIAEKKPDFLFMQNNFLKSSLENSKIISIKKTVEIFQKSSVK